jgi:hypothetical protein
MTGGYLAKPVYQANLVQICDTLGIFWQKSLNRKCKQKENHEDIHESLENFSSGKSGIDMVANDARDYAYALAASTVQLIIINKCLGEKALGKSYSMSTYNSDVNLFRELQQNYMSLGARLNADYKLYAYEIATLKE